MEKDIQSLQGENYEEADMGQLHAIHVNENAVAAVRARMKTGPSAEFCEECGDQIPEARRRAIQGVQYCVHCQEYAEKMSEKHARLYAVDPDNS